MSVCRSAFQIQKNAKIKQSSRFGDPFEFLKDELDSSLRASLDIRNGKERSAFPRGKLRVGQLWLHLRHLHLSLRLGALALEEHLEHVSTCV